jgi:pimeloyl-ACP methyl ester carboxylesterase
MRKTRQIIPWLWSATRLMVVIAVLSPLSLAYAKTDVLPSRTAGFPADAVPLYRQHIALGPAGRFMTVFANKNLSVTDSQIRTIDIVIHGGLRDADNYFRSAMAGAYLSGALDDTLIIAPRFAASDGSPGCSDVMESGELHWDCDNWKVGGISPDAAQVTAFAAIDEVVRTVTRAGLFPRLVNLTIVGHSGGGQFVSRYALMGKADDVSPIRPLYVPVNASSYPYLDRDRPLMPQDPTTPDVKIDPRDLLEQPRARFETVSNPRGCEAFNRWPYGLEGRPALLTGPDNKSIEKNFTSRRITYVAGQIDIVPLAGFDDSCGANMQGPNRLKRAIYYWQHEDKRYGANHPLVIVPLCGHDGRCMFTSPVLMPILFPR